MSTDIPAAAANGKFRKNLDRQAVDLALKGEWERAVEVNRAVLELFADDVEAMNRLAKALIELGNYQEAGEVLDRVCAIAPYNNIARKNRARVEQMRGSGSAATRHVRKHAGAPQLFIGESGKSAATTLRHTPSTLSLTVASPGDPVSLVVEHHGISVYAEDGQYLGQIESRLGARLSRLIQGGNTYEAAIIGVNGGGISIMIHETHRVRSLQNVASFPNRAIPAPARWRERDNDAIDPQSIDEDASDAEDEDEENVIDEDELQAAWNENE